MRGNTSGTISSEVEIDKITATEWDAAFAQFSDSNLYQTWAYGNARARTDQVSRCVIRRHGEVVGLAQLRLATPWKLRCGIAYLQWGPLWQRSATSRDPSILAETAEAVKTEYARRRGLLVKVQPSTLKDSEDEHTFHSCFSEFKPEPFRAGQTARTLILDLDERLDVIRKQLDSKWRNQLNRAEKNSLTATQSDQRAAFDVFIHLYEQMVERKGFHSTTDIRQYAEMQSQLAERQKMQVFLASADGHPAAGAIVSAHGNTGLYLFGATNEIGMKSKAAYLLQWKIITWLKEVGVRRYNLGGINPENNPGVYHFKNGMSGRDVLYSCPIIFWSNPSSWALVRIAELWRTRAARKRSTRIV